MSRSRVSARVAVLGATCRGGPYLKTALASLSAQTFSDWCLVLVDDGSPRPGDVAAEVEKLGHPSIVVRQNRRGLAVARNVALARSDSELVVEFDDDDVWMPTRLATQVSVLEREPDAVGCHTQFEIIDDQGRVTHPGDASPATLEQLLDGSRHPLVGTSMFRREFVDLVGWYHSSLRSAEDLDLLYRLAAYGPLVFIDEVLYQHRRHRQNVTNDYELTASSILEVLRLQRLAARSAQNRELVDAANRGILVSRRYWALQSARAGAGALRRGELANAYRHLSLALTLSPSTVIRRSIARIQSDRTA
jgi:glycosyltransferase involved in cell wall biosynthesis